MKLRTIAILRGFDPPQAADLADRCWGIGMDLVEVPVQGPEGWAALESVARCADGRSFGAGTVLTAADAWRAVELGASVVISPGIDREVVEAAAAAGALPLPGVMTPTEVGTAARLGLSACKLFPADGIGQTLLRALRGPFPDMGLVAVGGVAPHNAADFLRAGACGVAFGSSIEALLAERDPAGLIAQLHAAADARRAVGAQG
ncbi:MAG: 2-dehydro-3-deoxyphosphogluconate aldolase / (4S)-4-hydroxy-2-oxoglutarate aldolase [Thermoleophilaceae bacterium]|nr:2-dehydro-3-deoxyphosphogluconate aldolase / (4S)-4-hydroxy-2-oxoglutarate aldolase [Thermoleophilaceae bacterium]